MNTDTTPITTPSPTGKKLALIGSVFLFAPLAGACITIFAMISAMATTGRQAGAGEPEELSGLVSAALYAAGLGVALWFVGVFLVYLAIERYRFTPPWLKTVLIAAAVIALPFFPLGTIVGAATIYFVTKQKHRFAAPTDGFRI